MSMQDDHQEHANQAQGNQPKYPPYPWRLDTNSRYKDAVKVVVDLSTAVLIVPVFFLRNILAVPQEYPLVQLLNFKVYLSWASLALAILSGFIFFYFSGKWVRMAWGQKAGFFKQDLSEKVVEGVLDWSFVLTIAFFASGLGCMMWFVVTFSSLRYMG
jgi:hypothetical protein